MKKSIKLLLILSGVLSIMLLNACSESGNAKSNPTQKEKVEETIDLTIERHPAAADMRNRVSKYSRLPILINDECDIRNADLSASDLTNEYSKLLKTTFDSKTIWPEKMLENFKPDEIMEFYKNPGLGVRSLHERGITGKGVGIAIIDQTLLVDHIEYKDQLRYYSERITVKNKSAAMHGAAVAAIAVGKSVGVAPEADLYYIAEDFTWITNDYSLLAQSINKLLDINKSLPGENRIRVISISWGLDAHKEIGTKALNKAYQRAKDEGVLVITTSMFLREDFEYFGLDKYPLSDPEDFNSYTKTLYGKTKKRYNVSVPMNYRCTASPTGNKDYVVYREGGKSWATPYLAGVYVLACQVKPDITYEEFFKVAATTARSSHGTYEGEAYEAEYIIDPVAIMEELEKK